MTILKGGTEDDDSLEVNQQYGNEVKITMLPVNNLCQSGGFVEEYIQASDLASKRNVQEQQAQEQSRKNCFDAIAYFLQMNSNRSHTVSKKTLDHVLQQFAQRASDENDCLLQESRSPFQISVLTSLAFVQITNEFFGSEICESQNTALPRITRTLEGSKFKGNQISLLNNKALVLHVEVTPVYQIKAPFTILPFGMSFQTGQYEKQSSHALMLLINNTQKTQFMIDSNGIEWSTFLTKVVESSEIMNNLGFRNQKPKVQDNSDQQLSISSLQAFDVQNKFNDTILGFDSGICKPLSYFMTFLSILFGGTPWTPIAMILDDTQKKELSQKAINGFQQSILLQSTQYAYQYGSIVRAPESIRGGHS